MSKAEFAQEYEASFNSFEGQIYLSFDREKHVVDLSEFEITPDMDVIAGVDHGVRDATAFSVIAVKHIRDDDGEWYEEYYILDEYVMNERTTAQHAEELQKMIDKYGISLIFVDSAAAAFRMDLAYIHNIPSNLAKKSVVDGIGQVASLIDNDRVFIHHECHHHIDGLEAYRWDDRNLVKEKPIHDEHSHVMDALRYAVYSYSL